LGQALAGWLVSQGVTEDACGTTLDSKWLGRKSDPTGLGQAATPTIPIEPVQSALRDSAPDSTALVRGPFTKTIQPGPRGRTRTLDRTRTLGVVVAACALLAVSWAMVGRSSHATRAVAAAPPPPAVQAKLTSAPMIAPQLDAPRPAVVPADEPAPSPRLARVEAPAEMPARPEAGEKPRVGAARPLKLNSGPSRALPAQTAAIAVAASSVRPAPTSATRTERPLDLLTPY
jgi:hypothetical protein